MGFISELKKLTRPYDDEDDEFEDFSPANTRNSSNPKTPEQFRSSYAGFEEKRDGDKVVNIYTTARLQVVLVRPENFEGAAEIADHLKEKRTVVMNLERLSKDIARRIIDFASGAAYSLDGKINRIGDSTYIVTPYNVNLTGDLAEEIENNGLYF